VVQIDIADGKPDGLSDAHPFSGGCGSAV
jgi:hypothetical protein